MSALPLMIPLVIMLMRKLRDRGGTAMSATTAGAASGAGAAAAGRLRRAVPPAPDAGRGRGAGLRVLVIVWTLMPIYNMVMVSLELARRRVQRCIWPPHPSLESFWIVITQGYWYLEYFWHQFGNSLYIGAAVTSPDAC